MQTTDNTGNEIVETELPDTGNYANLDSQQAENTETEHASEVTHWCKPKMTTSLSKDLQAVIKEIAPSNVNNITQFIGWLAKEYQGMQNITNAYDENQHDLNKKLQDMDIEIEALQQSVSQLETEKTELLAKLETSPAPAPAPVPVPEKVPAPVKKNVPVDFMTLLGFNNGK